MCGVIDCNEWRTEKRHECANMGKVKRLELWWQLYRTSLPVWDLENFRPMDFYWHECTTRFNIRNLYIHFTDLFILYVSQHKQRRFSQYINLLVFIPKAVSVYCTVRTEFLYIPHFPAHKTHFFSRKMWPKFDLCHMRRG